MRPTGHAGLRLSAPTTARSRRSRRSRVSRKRSLLLGFGQTVLLSGAFLWLSGRFANAAGGGGGMFSFGRSRAKRYDQVAYPAGADTNMKPPISRRVFFWVEPAHERAPTT